MEPTDRTLTLTNINVHARDWGGDGAAVVLLHGLASNARIWDLTAPLLTARPLRVVALDQRGHGLTDKPPDGYDFHNITGDLAAAIDALGLDRPVVVGHSWGASVALDYAVRHTGVARGIVLVDGGVFELSRGMSWEEAEVKMAPPDLTKHTREEFVERLRGWTRDVASSEVTENAVMGNFYVAEDGRIRPHLSRENHMRILRSMYDQPTSSMFEQVRCPVLIAPAMMEYPDGAPAFLQHKREAVDRTLAALADGRVRWFENTVHDIPLHRPVELADVIGQFVESL